VLFLDLELNCAIEAPVAHCDLLIFESWSVPFIVAALLTKHFQALVTFYFFAAIKNFVPETRGFLLSSSGFGLEVVLATWTALLDFWLLLFYNK